MYSINYSPTKKTNNEQRMVQHKIKIVVRGKRFIKKNN